MDSVRHIDVAIIGSGVAGLGAGIKLRETGRTDFLIFEKDGAVGGTWWVNSYPGCACDVPSHLYSYSFEPNPHWSRSYSPQPEIQRYLQHCADKYGVTPHVRLNTEITRAAFDEGRGLWQLTDAGGRQYTAHKLIGATGALSRPKLPEIPGIESFQGPSFHSQQWDHEIDLTGKTVAVLGVGASAIQFVPAIAPRVGRLLHFQRTPPWVLPKLDRDFTRFEHWLFRTLPWTQKALRGAIYLLLEVFGSAFRGRSRLMALLQWSARQHIRRKIPGDPARQQQVTPGFDMGCKRVLFSNDYYPALARDNVTVIRQGVREVTADGLIADDGSAHAVDVIIYGTGFEVARGAEPGRVYGRDGLDLAERWRDGNEAYAGTTVSGFPNLFLVPGPNVGSGHTSMFYFIESQLRYVMDAIRQMDAQGLATVEIRREVETAYNERLQAALRDTVWQTGGCRSWYLDDRGRNVALWPTATWHFRRLTSRFRLDEYDTTATGQTTAAIATAA